MGKKRALALSLGLSENEYTHIKQLLGREPSRCETAIFSAMWSEHCAYKSSRRHLRMLPSDGEHVLQGPGENAGIVDIGDGLACVFKIESHNHPSMIEPFQGAATGVGGIMRDIFTMGARPIANLNALFFGAADEKMTPYYLARTVAGIAAYGNCMGVPTVGGMTSFDSAYAKNILVNAMTVGIARKNKLFFARAESAGDLVLCIGSPTGRDGVHGASMASESFTDAPHTTKRPNVQIADPFTEKLLLEACLELMDKGKIRAIQDMGAAGLTSSSVEMAYRGGRGMRLDLDALPCRETGMTPLEMMLSETQERMLLVTHPENVDAIRAVCSRLNLAGSVIGRIVEEKRLIVMHKGEKVADLPLRAIVKEAPVLDRPHDDTLSPKAPLALRAIQPTKHPLESLLDLLEHREFNAKSAIVRQFDHSIMADTLRITGTDSALVRVHNTSKLLAISLAANPFYCNASPFEGGRHVICAAYRKLCASGAKPLAFTNCLNFASPEEKHVMTQFVHVLRGMRDASMRLSFPVVSGNVSFYNQTAAQGIPPTPVIGGVGLIEHIADAAFFDQIQEGASLWLIGTSEADDGLAQSAFARLLEGRRDTACPRADPQLEEKHGRAVRLLAAQKILCALKAVTSGGVLMAATKMALGAASGLALVTPEHTRDPVLFWFAEAPACYLVALTPQKESALQNFCTLKNISLQRLGVFAKQTLSLSVASQTRSVSLQMLYDKHEASPEQGDPAMPVSRDELETTLKHAFPDATIEITDLANDEDHYAVTIASSVFSGKTTLRQHQLVYRVLGDVMRERLHALSLKTIALAPNGGTTNA